MGIMEAATCYIFAFVLKSSPCMLIFMETDTDFLP